MAGNETLIHGEFFEDCVDQGVAASSHVSGSREACRVRRLMVHCVNGEKQLLPQGDESIPVSRMAAMIRSTDALALTHGTAQTIHTTTSAPPIAR